MIMLRLARAVTASGVALAVIQATGCGGDGVAENKGAVRLAAASSDAVADAENPSEHGSRSAAMAVEADVEHMMHPTLVELHHFNVYQNFLAMLDAASDVHGNDKNRGDSGTRYDAGSAGTRYFVCSGTSLIKQGD